MTASTLSEDLNPAGGALAPWPAALPSLTPRLARWSPGMALLRRLTLRRRWQLPAVCALLPALLALGWILRGELLDLAVLDEQLRGVAQSETLLSATMALRDLPREGAVTSGQAEWQQRLGELLTRLHASTSRQEPLNERVQSLRSRLAELKLAASVAAESAPARPSDGIDALLYELQSLRQDVLQGLGLQRDADVRVRELAMAAAQSLPLLAPSLQASLQSSRALPASDPTQRRDLARGLIEQRAEASLAFEQARMHLQRSVAVRWLDAEPVAATLAQIEQQLASMDRIARAAQSDAGVGVAMVQDYLRLTRRTLSDTWQLQSHGLGVLRDALQVRRAALVQRVAVLTTAAVLWWLAVSYLLGCAGGLLDESLRRLRAQFAALAGGVDAGAASDEASGDELEQAQRLLRQASDRLGSVQRALAASAAAVAHRAQTAADEHAALALRTGEVRGGCAEVAQRLHGCSTILEQCTHSAQGTIAELGALADDTQHARLAMAALRARLLAASGSHREIAHVVQGIDAAAQRMRLLALNALAEAQRIGAPAHGFAVVMQELRALAQRNEQSARALHPMIAASGAGIDEIHLECALADEAEQDTERRLQAVQHGIDDVVRRAESGSGETRQMLQSARRVQAGLDAMVDQLERLAQALAALRGQARPLPGAAPEATRV